MHVFNNWESAQDRSLDNSIGFITQADGDSHWKQPHMGIIKINIDAALFEVSSSYGHAMVARNHEGIMLETRSSTSKEEYIQN